jgi:hypothetical protein
VTWRVERLPWEVRRLPLILWGRDMMEYFDYLAIILLSEIVVLIGIAVIVFAVSMYREARDY